MTAIAQRKGTGPAKIVVVGGLKGGIGKTTAAMFVALVYAIIHRSRVLFVDADPSSQSGYDWFERTSNPETGESALPMDLEVWPTDKVGALAMKKANQYDIIVIDCGGDTDRILAAAVAVAYYVLVVVTPEKANLARLQPSLVAAADAAVKAERPETPIWVVFTKVDRRRVKYNQAVRDELAAAGITKADVEIPYIGSMYSDTYGEVPTELGDFERLVKEVDEEVAA